MKTIIITGLLMGITFISCAQDIAQKDVPTTVVSTFEKSYPKAYDIEWEKKGNLYNVEFEVNHQDIELWIDANGKIERKSEDMSIHDVPEAVKSSFKSKYPHHKIDDIDRVSTDTKVVYIIEAEDKYDNDFDVVFDEKGNETKL